MIQHLVKYFSIHGRLVLPGIGSLVAETKPAQLEFVEKTLHAPQYNIIFVHDSPNDEKINTFLSYEMKVSAADAAAGFKEFMHHLSAKLQAGTAYPIPGLGILSGNGLGYHFRQSETLHTIYTAVTAGKIIRQNAPHSVRVGEDHRTSSEMQELLQAETTASRWWIGAVILGVIGVSAVLYYYLTK